MRKRDKPVVAAEAEAEARRKIEHKIKVLGTYRRKGVPEGKESTLPRSLNQFTKWHDEAPGHQMKPAEAVAKATLWRAGNADLKATAELLVDHFRAKGRERQARQKTRKSELERLRTLRKELEERVTSLTSQFTAERWRAQELEKELQSAYKRVDDLKQDKAKLWRQLMNGRREEVQSGA